MAHDPDRPATFARRLLRLFGRTLGAPVGLAAVLALRLTARRAGIALMYHNVEWRDGDLRRELVPPHHASLFARQVAHLRRHYRVVPAAELRDAARARRRGQRFPVAITFDDDLQCHASIALPILQRAGVHATFFLSGASLESPHAFWWERLRLALERGIPDVAELVGAPAAPGGEVEVHALGRYVIALPPGEVDAVAARLGAALGPDPPTTGMSAEDIAALAAAGMAVGFHTLRHDFLARLTDDELVEALEGGRTALAEAAGAPLLTIGYPYGSADARVAEAARAAGYREGFTTRHVAVVPESDQLLQGRVGPSRRSVGAMALQLAFALVRAGSERSTPAPGRAAS